MKKILVCIFTLLFCCNVFAGEIKDVVFFGDSLTDDGNLLSYMKIVPKSPPYYKSQISNGITWAEHVGNYLYDKSYIKYANYAYGGATAILHHLRTDPFVAPIILPAELESYFLHQPLKDKSKVLFSLWIGANDYLYERKENIDELTNDVVDSIVRSLTNLIEKGGKYFLVMNLPDLSLTPYARTHGNQERLAAISVMHNTKLAKAVASLKASHPNVTIAYMDIYTIFVDMLKHPEQYNEKYGTHVTDTTEVCWPGTVLGLDQSSLTTELQQAFGQSADSEKMRTTLLNSPALATAYAVGKRQDQGHTACTNADEHVFWDELHPTAVIHQVLGKIIIDLLKTQMPV